jgi:hypothetical protein
MSTFFESPADARPGEKFHHSENCVHWDGEIIRVEPGNNAADREGHIVIWREIDGGWHRTPWSKFREGARRTPTNPVEIPVLTWHGCYDSRWEGLMTKEAFVHPAKFSPGLIDRIYTHGLAVGWWNAGETIGDPFGGVAGGGIFAGYHGLNWVGVELEEKFVTLGNANLVKHGPKWLALGEASRVVLLQGDSRRFAEIVSDLDGIACSPPFLDARSGTTNSRPAEGETKRRNHTTQAGAGYGTSEANIDHLPPGDLDGIVSSPPYAGLGGGGADSRPDRLEGSAASVKINRDSYGIAAGQIGRAATGKVDAILTSPPYADTNVATKDKRTAEERVEQIRRAVERGDEVGDEFKRILAKGINPNSNLKIAGYGRTAGQIGAMKAVPLDGVVTSPPFSVDQPCASQTRAKKDYHAFTRGNGTKRDQTMVTPGNIQAASVGDLDAVVTSPPWEDQESAMNAGKFKDPAKFAQAMTNRDGKDGRNGTSQRSRAAQFDRATQTSYGESDGQLGNVTGETYWEAMSIVYAQCLLALKPGGVMAVVVKDYVKGGQRVPLCDQTLRLLLHLGFEPVCRIHAMLVKEHHHNTLFEGRQTTRTERKSFFRRLAEKKGSPRIDWEEVLVVRKAAMA